MTQGRAKTVLIVDDSGDNADTLAALIRALGHRALVAYDAVAGLRIAHEELPDVIFHDIAMPDMDGYCAVRELKKHHKFAATRIVALTAFVTPQDRERALAAGFDLHLGKPVELTEIQNVLNG